MCGLSRQVVSHSSGLLTDLTVFGSRDARVALVKIHCKANPVPLTDQEWSTLADLTDGYSGSDISSMVLGALFQPIRDMQAAKYWHVKEGKAIIPQ